MSGTLAQIDWIAASAAVTAVAAVLYTGFTIWLVLETMRMRRAQTDPCVIVYMRQVRSAPHCFELVVENVGKGPACNVHLQPTRSIPSAAFGIEKLEVDSCVPMSSGPFVNGIPFLPAGESRIHFWGQFGGLREVLGEDGIFVTASCTSDKAGKVPVASVTSHLEWKSFDELRWLDEKGLDDIHGALKDLAKTMEHAATGFKPLLVETPASRKRRENESMERYRKKAAH